MRKMIVALSLAVAASMVLVAHTAARAAVPQSHQLVRGAEVVQAAEKYLGTPFTQGSIQGPTIGFGDLGYVRFIYNSVGITVPATRHALYARAPHVKLGRLQLGDVVYFRNTLRVGLSHVGIYVGDGKFIHAEWYDTGVRVTSIQNDSRDGSYWANHYMGANRPWAGT